VSLLTSGWLSRPVSRRIRIRRSTVLMLAAFLGLGALYVQIRTVPDDDPPATVTVTVTPDEPVSAATDGP
jgi:hypothetical protein